MQPIALIEKIFSPLFALDPIITVFIFSAFLAILITVINKYLVNRKFIKEIKARMIEVREKLSKSQKNGNNEEINRYMNEYMRLNVQMLKQNFKSVFVSIIIFMLFIPILNIKYGGDKDAGTKPTVVAVLPFKIPFIGNTAGWLLWYIIVSFTVSTTFKKIIGE